MLTVKIHRLEHGPQRVALVAGTRGARLPRRAARHDPRSCGGLTLVSPVISFSLVAGRRGAFVAAIPRPRTVPTVALALALATVLVVSARTAVARTAVAGRGRAGATGVVAVRRRNRWWRFVGVRVGSRRPLFGGRVLLRLGEATRCEEDRTSATHDTQKADSRSALTRAAHRGCSADCTP